MIDSEQYYRALELEPGASLEEVNQAYRDLAFIWHPDRVPQDNLRLQQKAQAKLKELNLARDRLRSIQPSPRSKKTQPQPAATRQTARDRQPPRTYYYQSHYQTHQQQSDLSGADFRGANLREKDLSGRNLSQANLSHANLSDAFLHQVNLHSANLENANLFRANLLQANLVQANLRGANLIGADLSGADLSGADLRGAKIGTKDRVFVKFTGAKLTKTIMPDGTIHN